ncbi:MAG: squalene synthase HpnD [Rhizobiales bacterium NRL2]|jgi:phytoene synthase|nr:MAG: squalene synthase HpnD [Rhizobiales bacterium NRL2]
MNEEELRAAQAHAERIVKASGTSFGLGMRVLPEAERRAMYAVYAFCREIDDIADEPGEEQAKRDALDEWRREIDALYHGRPTRPTAQALLPAIDAYDLPHGEFVELIEGMVMDVDMDFRRRTWLDHDGLHLYCRRVAGAVGLLSVRIFGEPDATQFALAMGDALQLTNILRDIGEDAAEGRLYLPIEMIREQGITAEEPSEIVRDPRLKPVCEAIAGEARQRFRDADELLTRHDRRKLKPALIMGSVYRGYLERLEARGFDNPAAPVRLSKFAKAGRALRAWLG